MVTQATTTSAAVKSDDAGWVTVRTMVSVDDDDGEDG